MIKNLLPSFTVFLLLSLAMAGCQKKGTPHDEEGIIDVVIIELPDGLPTFECTIGIPDSVTTYYTDEITTGSCLPQIQNIDLPNSSSNAIGIIIKSQASFKKLIQCNSFSGSIDFEKYFVLGGFYYKSKAFLDSLNVFTCDNSLVFKMNMSKGVGGDIGFVFSMAVIDRKYMDKEIFFDMQLK